MKTLALFGYFKLPDDFNGTMSDAIRQLAKYHEEPHPTTVTDIVDVSQKNQWQGFCKGCMQSDKRVFMGMGISELKQGQWVQIIQGGSDAKSKLADAADQTLREQIEIEVSAPVSTHNARQNPVHVVLQEELKGSGKDRTDPGESCTISSGRRVQSSSAS